MNTVALHPLCPPQGGFSVQLSEAQPLCKAPLRGQRG